MLKKDKHKIKLLLKSLARNESTTVTSATLKRDIQEKDFDDVDVDTIACYLNLLDRLFLLDNDKPFLENIGSKIRVKQAEKRHFADPSLAVALLNLTEEKLINDLETFDFLFEPLVIRDLKIYSETFDGKTIIIKIIIIKK